jgi:hypothetical protein
MSINTVPNIISGHVTRSANSPRKTPNWLKAIYAAIFGVITIIALALTLAPTQEAQQSIPACKQEDGIGQQVCAWDDGTGDKIINFQNGRYSYNVTADTMHDWTNE